MASPDNTSQSLSSDVETFDWPPMCWKPRVPEPPPPSTPGSRDRNHRICFILNKAKETWDKLFKDGFGADVHIMTEDGSIIPAHYSLLCAASPVLGNFLKQSEMNNGIRYKKVPGMPYDAVRIFIRFLYSASYDEAEMKKFALHLLVLSHSYSVPLLKRLCEHIIEHGLLNSENVIDMLQLARKCDAPRLSLMCTRMVVMDLKTVSLTEGWKMMRRSNRALEQELLEFVVDADRRKQERAKKTEEKKVYLQLYEAMEALVHICKDGCRTIGPRDKVLKRGQGPCNYLPACKGLETLVRHFSTCRTRVPGGCVPCKRMWQLLELHSRMCNQPDSCCVPLCRHFKQKLVQQTKKGDAKWKALVSKVRAARLGLGPFSSRGSALL